MGTPSRIKRVLVVVKTSKHDRYVERGSLHEGGGEGDDDRCAVHARLQAAHDAHTRAASCAETVLEATGRDIVYAAQPRKRDAARADLVVSVGGDGTFLRCAQRVVDTPILGVNSAPGSSTGHYCGATVDTLAEVLDAILGGALAPTELGRLSVTVGPTRLPYAALNDVLFAHRTPACSARYLLQIDDLREFQLSSGIWIATASGSSGAILSAGGQRMAPGDVRTQYRVREVYARAGQRVALERGFVSGPIHIISRSPSNGLYLDGFPQRFTVGFGARATIERAATPLRVYGSTGPHR